MKNMSTWKLFSRGTDAPSGTVKHPTIENRFNNLPDDLQNKITPTEKKNETKLFIFKYLKTMF